MADSDGLHMKYFVLKPEGTDAYAKASRKAMRAYATAIQSTNPQMCDDLRVWVDSLYLNTLFKGGEG